MAGLTVGVFTLVLSSWLSALYAMPRDWVVVIGLANVGYGLFSFALARRSHRPLGLIALLVIANGMWAVFCAIAAVWFAGDISYLGVAHLSLECAFVGGLAVLEWRNRDALMGIPSSTGLAR